MQAKEEKINDSQVKERNFFTKLSASRANPFLTQMFFRMSFHAWYNYMGSKVDYMKWEIQKEKDRKHHKRLGKTFIEPVYKEPEVPYQDVEIEYEVFTEISCTSGDSDDDLLEKSITVSQYQSIE